MSHNESRIDRSSIADMVAQTTGQAIRAARAYDFEAFDATADLLALHPESREVHALMLRELLETAFPDGLTGDDVSEVMTTTSRAVASWNSAISPASLALVLTGALGVGDTADSHALSSAGLLDTETTAAALLVIADLAARAEVDPAAYLTRAVEEIRRAQTMEMP
ncbi:hypothetical protein [Gordonia sp. KTR9]|uniref:hypothetical protein n=1 Tax=Gordonia sp. KTR9 TaxID=337191 RepID=UPI00027DE3D9|nr:hypothetical protein [Gordonia sp. KTR9]AFR49174.1 hypothetical protein KTR9_2537 [Gordonia sp. KTR9]